MANWSLPSLTDLYTNFLTYLKARDDDATRMHDSRVTAATNVPDYAKRWNATTQTFQNWLSAAWSSIVLAVAGGGTGATTAAGARTNLDVYSTAEVDALVEAANTTAENVLSANVSLTTDGVYYDGPSVSLAEGTWLVIGTCVMSLSAGAYNGSYTIKLWDGVSAAYITNLHQVGYNSYIDQRFSVPINDIITLGATTTVKISAGKSGASTSYIMGTYSNIRAVKIG